jgi:hypothetical protein
MNFYTDVIKQDKRFHSSSRIIDSALLEPITRQKVVDLIAAAALEGIALMIFETYRSKERQEVLFNAGASKLRTVGVHHYGLACDIVRAVNKEPSWKGDFTFLGRLAKDNGLIWGGDWGAPGTHHSFVDSVHVQRCTVGDQEGLFAGTWYPEVSYNPYNVVITLDRPL